MHGLFSSYTPSLKAHISHDQWVQEYHSWWWPDHSISPQRERNDSINRSQSQSHTPSFFTTSTHLSTSNKHHTSLSSRSSTFSLTHFHFGFAGRKVKREEILARSQFGHEILKTPPFIFNPLDRARFSPNQNTPISFFSLFQSQSQFTIHNSDSSFHFYSPRVFSLSNSLGFSIQRWLRKP